MTIWILLIVVTLIITLAVLVYKHDNTEFARLTGYSLFDIVLNAKKSHLHKLMTQLDKVSGEHKVLIDLHLPVNNTNYPVDARLSTQIRGLCNRRCEKNRLDFRE